MKDKHLFWILGIVFVTLKLVGVIDWSWWWVTLPFWGMGALIIIIGVSALPFIWWKGNYK